MISRTSISGRWNDDVGMRNRKRTECGAHWDASRPCYHVTPSMARGNVKLTDEAAVSGKEHVLYGPGLDGQNGCDPLRSKAVIPSQRYQSLVENCGKGRERCGAPLLVECKDFESGSMRFDSSGRL